MSAFVALLRGINVGGRNKIAMADLREAFEEAGHRSVRTYIQSGNVLFEADASEDDLEVSLEAMLAARYGTALAVVVVSHAALRRVVDESPAGFGEEPDRHLDDVIFLRRPLTAAEVMAVVDLKEGVDRAWAGPGVLYFSRLAERRTASRLVKLTSTGRYRSMTVRNWNTTTRLLAMLDSTD